VEQGFLDALRDDPDDRLHHLVFADWLEENGRAGRADYVRAWWQVQALPRRKREAARDALHTQYEGQIAAWLGPEKEALRSSRFDGAVLSCLDFWQLPPAEEVAGWLERYAVREVRLYSLPNSHQLARLAAFRHIRELTAAFTNDDFFLWPHLPPLRRLTLNQMPTPLARLLACTPRLASLRAIAGPAMDLDDSGVMALLRSPHLMGLEEWDVIGENDTPLSLLHLFRGGRAKRWRSLTYTNQRASLAHIAEIGRCENLRRLTLRLPFDMSDRNPLECLEPLRRLRELTLSNVGSVAIARLAAWPGLRGLEFVSLRGPTLLPAEAYEPLLSSAHRNAETILDIPGVPS
jgi:uncharacterized protein (TIGR02996 family)